MGGCSAMKCSNSSKKKKRMFRFPADPLRRKIWALNCRGDAWVPGPNAQLCNDHFEESQFEQHREDKWKKLKQTAIPTLFNVPNTPVMAPLQIKGNGRPKPDTLLEARIDNGPQDCFEERQFEQYIEDNWRKLKQTPIPMLLTVSNTPIIVPLRAKEIQSPEPCTLLKADIYNKPQDHFEENQFEQNREDKFKNVPNTPPIIVPLRIKEIGRPEPNTLLEESKFLLKQRILDLEIENNRLRRKLEDQDKSLSFLSDEQRQKAKLNKQSIACWSQEGILQARKLSEALGKFGYNYLRSTGYPCPSFSTLNRRKRAQILKDNNSNAEKIISEPFTVGEENGVHYIDGKTLNGD